MEWLLLGTLQTSLYEVSCTNAVSFPLIELATFKNRNFVRINQSNYAVVALAVSCYTLCGLPGAIGYFKAIQLSGRSTTLDFCFGGPRNMIVTMEDKVYGLQVKNFIFIVAIFLLIARTLIYFYLFIELYFQNESMTGILSKTSLRNRKQRNAITLTGQMTCFVVEILSMVVLVVIITFGHSFSILNGAPSTIILAAIHTPILSVTLIFGSTDLRNHLIARFT